MGPAARILPDGRLHLQHGPSDLIIFAEGDRKAAYRAAESRFASIISEVMQEHDLLRQALDADAVAPVGAVALRMHEAALPCWNGRYLTRMAAVAGAIADEVLAAMQAATGLARAYVNNGGDIALYLAPGTSFTTAMLGHDGQNFGTLRIAAEDPVRGIATSGRHGRSLSLGVADSVTVLAKTAARADVAATLVANAVDLPGHPAIQRRPAHDVVDDSDLGALPVVVGCGVLRENDVATAVSRGVICAETMRARNLIFAAGLFLQDQVGVTAGAPLELRKGDASLAGAETG